MKEGGNRHIVNGGRHKVVQGFTEERRVQKKGKEIHEGASGGFFNISRRVEEIKIETGIDCLPVVR